MDQFASPLQENMHEPSLFFLFCFSSLNARIESWENWKPGQNLGASHFIGSLLLSGVYRSVVESSQEPKQTPTTTITGGLLREKKLSSGMDFRPEKTLGRVYKQWQKFSSIGLANIACQKWFQFTRDIASSMTSRNVLTRSISRVSEMNYENFLLFHYPFPILVWIF